MSNLSDNDFPKIPNLKFIEKVNYAPEHDFDEDESAGLWSQESVSVFGKLSFSEVVSFIAKAYVTVCNMK